MNGEILKMTLKNAIKEALNAADRKMMIDCEYYKSSKSCLVGLYQKEYCNKDCEYYKPEKV